MKNCKKNVKKFNDFYYLQLLLRWTKNAKFKELNSRTGCQLKCSATKVSNIFYTFIKVTFENIRQYWVEEQETESNIGWRHDWVSEVFIEAHPSIEEHRDHLIYDSNNLVTKLGFFILNFLFRWGILEECWVCFSAGHFWVFLYISQICS